MTEDTYIKEYSVNKSVKLSTYIAPLQRVQETLAIVYMNRSSEKPHKAI